ncbi:MAG: DnaJ domain-containing protein [Oscillospiraceae bacterium]|nr:DnaJ domain-containing protein [Oscillospiraceae bacterium]
MNYYDVFGVSPTATTEVINATHKALAKMYHPDVNSSKDAHEKMAMLNEANEVLSDTTKRKKYDSELRRNQQQAQNQETLYSQRSRGSTDAEARAEKAEMLRRRAETKLKADAMEQDRRKERTQQKVEEAARKNRQERAEFDKRDVIKGLSAVLMRDTLKLHKKMDVDEERYYAIKVLLSMVKKDDKHLQEIIEETQRKQRIEEILTLVKGHNDKKE